MTIRLTPRQYRTMVKMAWIASRVANGSELQDSETVENIMDLTDYLCNAAGSFGAEDMFEMVDLPPDTEAPPEFSVGTPLPQAVRLKQDIEEDLLSIIEWFEEFSFWEILEDRLAMRDISEERTEAQWNWLPDNEKDRLYNKYVDFYFEQFAETGVSTLRLVPPKEGQSPLPLGWGNSPGDSESSSDGPSDKSRRPGKIIEFPGSGRPDGKPPKKPRT